ncbi:threonylcarbamoyl-AMP synthase [Pseudarthrobacter sp. NamE2]|uniref:L-threonylcarbamoyladenylate synthase n=1 Tax=Pseudarthrobacter sp. NamE2 TaxID=2576838 RepID=UPI0010FE6A35|nr:L-threonylcarbamoyladenylate synthase [Pseudarthrobacter sp. NamE2]TLM82343.1 threonylcarbamoyl-AMP synthase [Pseudarthrobacter sp. NamE2]
MTTTYDCTVDDQRAQGLEHAQRAISEKKCVVFPTDTVYGIAADAFSPQAVTMLLVSKGRSRTMPPPVLIPRINALDGLAAEVSADARKLAEAFWPGGLTLILHAQPSLDWDLGETKGTVALRMPDDEIAQELLTLTGPLAVSSANRTGHAPAQTAAAAREQLADSVEVYLEGGFRPAEGALAVPSTIVDATGPRLRVVRNGAVSLDQLREHVPGVLGLGEIPMAEEEPAAEEPVEEKPAVAPVAPAAPAASGGSSVVTPESGVPATQEAAADQGKQP